MVREGKIIKEKEIKGGQFYEKIVYIDTVKSMDIAPEEKKTLLRDIEYKDF